MWKQLKMHFMDCKMWYKYIVIIIIVIIIIMIAWL